MILDEHLLGWLRTHHSTISTGAAVGERLLLHTDERRRLVTAGVLRRVVNGAYVFAGASEDELSRCSALCTSRPTLVIAGPTAARLWELRRAPRDRSVHVIGPPHSNPCRAPWVQLYRTDSLRPEEVVSRADGVRVTSPPRTVIDVARSIDDHDLASLLEHALERRMCTEVTLTRMARRLVAPRRPWVNRVIALLAARSGRAPAESEWERRVLQELLHRGVEGVVSQHRIDLPGYGRARFDIAVPELRWALEVDVHPDHRSREGTARDNRRDSAAYLAGWIVRRVAEVQLTASFTRTMDEIVATLDWRRRSLSSSR